MPQKTILILLLVALAGAGLWFFYPPASVYAPLTYAPPPARETPRRADLEWRSSGDAPWPPRDAAAALVWRDKVWLLGGLNGGQGLVNNVKYWELPHFNDIWSFDGAVWNQEIAAASWPTRRSMSLVNFQNRLWLFGGINFDQPKVYNDSWFSDDGLNWTLATSSSPWSPRYDHAVEVFGGKLWLVGGVADGVASSDVWVSDNGLAWRQVTAAAPWGRRHGHALLNWPAPATGSGERDRLWLVSGWDTDANRGVDDVWSSADGENWELAPTAAPWLGREDHAALIFQDQLWLLAGMDTDWRWRRDVWRGEFKWSPEPALP